MTGEIGIGLIGCGQVASVHAQVIGEVEGARLVAVADSRYSSAAAFADTWSCDAVDTSAALCCRDDVDLVAICSPSGLHAAHAIEALEAGRHVLVEKPVAITATQLDALEATLAARPQQRLAVISQLRFSPAFEAVQSALAAGRFGTLLLATLEMPYYRRPAYYASGSWRGSWALDGGGALMNQGIHGIDLLLALMGDARWVDGVAATRLHAIEVEDTAAACIGFTDGALGVLTASTATAPGAPRRLSLRGSAGYVVLEEERIVDYALTDGAEDAFAALVDAQTEREGAHSSHEPMAFERSGHRRQYIDLLDAIRSGGATRVGLSEGRRAVDLILALYRASEIGGRVLL